MINHCFRIHYLHIEFDIITFISIFGKCRKNKRVLAYSLGDKSRLIIQRQSSGSVLVYFWKGMGRVSVLLLLLGTERVSLFCSSLSLNPAAPSQRRVVSTTLNDKSFNRHFSGIKKNLTLFHCDATELPSFQVVMSVSCTQQA